MIDLLLVSLFLPYHSQFNSSLHPTFTHTQVGTSLCKNMLGFKVMKVKVMGSEVKTM